MPTPNPDNTITGTGLGPPLTGSGSGSGSGSGLVTNGTSTSESALFQQLWTGIAQLQHESGITKQAWTAKDRENAALRSRASDLGSALEKERSRVAFLTQRVADLEQALSEREDERSKLAAKFTSELKSTKALIEAHSKGAQQAIAQCKSVESKLMESQRSLELEKRRREEQEQKTSNLDSMLRSVTHKFEQARQLLVQENHALKQANANTNDQIRALQASQTTDAQRMLQLADASKALKADLRSASHRERLLHDRLRQQLMERDKVEALQQENIKTLEKEIDRLCSVEKKSEAESVSKEATIKAIQAEMDRRKQAHAGAMGLLQLDIAKREQMVEALTKQVGMLEMEKAEEAKSIEKMQAMIRTVQEKHLKDACSFEHKIKQMEQEKNDAAKVERQLTMKLQAAQASNQALTRQIEQLRAEVNALESGQRGLDLEAHQDEVAALNKEIEAQQKAAASFKERSQAETAALLKKLDETEVELNHLQLSRKEIEAELERSSRQLTEVTSEAKLLRQEAAMLAEKLEKEEAEVEQLNTRMLDLSRELRKAREEQTAFVTAHKQTLDEEKKHRCELEEEKRNLILECQKLNDMASSGSVAQAEMERNLQRLTEEKQQVEQMLSRHQKAAKIREKDASDHVDELQKEVAQLVKEKQQSILLVNSVKSELQSAKKAFKQRLTQAEDETTSAKEESRQILLKVQQGKKKLEERLASAKSLREEKKELATELKALKASNAEALSAAKARADSFQQDAQTAHAAAKKQISIAADARDQCASLEKSLDRARQDVDSMKASLVRSEQLKQTAYDKLALVEEEYASLRRGEDKKQVLLSDLQSEKVMLEQQLKALKVELKTAATHAGNKEESVVQLEKELSNERRRAAATEAELKQLEAAGVADREALSGELKAAEEQHQKEVQELKASLQDQRETVKEMQTRLEQAAGQAKEMREALKEENESLCINLRQLKTQQDGLVRELDEAHGLNDTRMHELQASQAQVQLLHKRVTEAEESHHSTEADLTEAKRSLASLKAKLHEQGSVHRQKLREAEKAEATARADVESAVREKEWQENEHRIRIAAMERKVSTLQTDLSRKDDEVASANVKLREAGDELQRFQAVMRKEMIDLRSRGNERVAEMEAALESARSENARVVEELQELEDAKVGLQRSVSQWQRKHSHAEEEVNRLTVTNAQLQAQIQQMHTQKRKMETKLKHFKLAAQDPQASPSSSHSPSTTRSTRSSSSSESEKMHGKNARDSNEVTDHKTDRIRKDDVKKGSSVEIGKVSHGKPLRSNAKPGHRSPKAKKHTKQPHSNDERKAVTNSSPSVPSSRWEVDRCEEEKRSEGESPESEDKSFLQRGNGESINGDLNKDVVTVTVTSPNSLKLPRMVTRKFDKEKDAGHGQKGSKIRFLHNNEKLPTVFRT